MPCCEEVEMHCCNKKCAFIVGHYLHLKFYECAKKMFSNAFIIKQIVNNFNTRYILES